MRHLRFLLLGLLALAALLVGVPAGHGAHISPTVVATIAVGNSPHGVGVNPSTDRIYVQGGGNVSVIDGASNAVIATVRVGLEAYGVGVNPTTNRIYVANYSDVTVSVIDGASNVVIATVNVGRGLYGVGVNPSTNRIYVSNVIGDTVSVIDGASNAVIATVPVGDGPRGVGVNSSTDRVYVANGYGDTVSVIDGASNAVVATVAVGDGPKGVGVNSSTDRVYVSNLWAGTVSVIDGASNAVVATVPVGDRPEGVGVNPTTGHVYVSNPPPFDPDTVSVIDGASNAVVATVPVGDTPFGVAVNPATDRVYVAGGGTVSVIENDTDGDGLGDSVDNCPDTSNPGQENNVHPGTAEGDHCEDPDTDLVPDIDDNCPDTPNPAQADSDGDGIGDACDTCPAEASSGLSSPTAEGRQREMRHEVPTTAAHRVFDAGGDNDAPAAVSVGGPVPLERPDKPHPKLDSQLSQLAEEHRARGPAAAKQQARLQGVDLVDERVRVIVQAQPGREALAVASARTLGGEVEATHRDLVQVLAPLGILEALADEGAVRLVRQPLRAIPTAVTGEGVALINADDWQQAGVAGCGVKVAVLDLGFLGYPSLLGSELPGSVVTHSCRANSDITGGGIDHGTAVAEIAHEVAPGASLYLVNFGTEVELGNCVDWLISQGVNVINHSIIWFGTGAGDGSGPINAIASSATANGILWAQAAGNQAQSHWSGVWSDNLGDDFHNFAPNDESNAIYAFPGELIIAVLKWDDPFGGSCNDYDLLLFGPAPNFDLLTLSVDVQSCSQDPVEGLSWVAQVEGFYHIVIFRCNDPGIPCSANGLANFHLYSLLHFLQYVVSAGSLLEPADNPDVVAVGAVNWATPDVIEPFSSQGPTSDGKVKPDIVGPDGVSNATFGSFFGTSSSTAHVAGAAALVWQLNSCLSRADVQSFLEGRAVGLGAPGKDNIYGSGRLNLALPNDSDGDGIGDACDATPFVIGDADCDSDVDAVDGLFVLQHVAGLRGVSSQCPAQPITSSSPIFEAAADADCDSDVDAVDGLFVLQHVAGLRPELCPP